MAYNISYLLNDRASRTFTVDERVSIRERGEGSIRSRRKLAGHLSVVVRFDDRDGRKGAGQVTRRRFDVFSFLHGRNRDLSFPSVLVGCVPGSISGRREEPSIHTSAIRPPTLFHVALLHLPLCRFVPFSVPLTLRGLKAARKRRLRALLSLECSSLRERTRAWLVTWSPDICADRKLRTGKLQPIPSERTTRTHFDPSASDAFRLTLFSGSRATPAYLELFTD